MGRCKFKEDWLKSKDANGFLVSSWAKRNSDNTIYCKLCSRVINITLKGFQAIMQHSSSTKHKEKSQDILDGHQLQLTSGIAENKILPTIQLYSIRESATIAELIWCMKAVCSNYSAASCRNIEHTFKAMFPGVPDDFCINPKKMHYLVTDALSPYFYQNMLEEAQSSYYTISYDETTNVEDKKELLTTIRYWSMHKNEVVTKHLATSFIGHADAVTLHAKITEAIENANLSLTKLLMMGSDGPNVNKKVNRLFNEDILRVREKGLIDIGTCNIHTMHNAYRKGLETFGHDASDFLIALYHYFDGWPSRYEDYTLIQKKMSLPSHKFVKHSATRWLTLKSACERALEQWEGIISYFLKHIPLKKSKLMCSNSYKKIISFLKTPTAKAELLFILSSSMIFVKFTAMFQKKEPLVHLIYTEIKNVVLALLGRICKPSVLKQISEDSGSIGEIFSTACLLPLKKMVTNNEIKIELEKLSEKENLYFLKNCQNHYVESCRYILQKTSSEVLKALRFLQPKERKSLRSCRDILTVVNVLPFNIQTDILMDEWKMLQLDTEQETTEDTCKYERIDKYWNSFMQKQNSTGAPKYPNVNMVIKACLCLSHGAADIERAFSISRWTLTEDKAPMSERTLNSLMIVKDALKEYDNEPHLVPITKKLISLARTAHHSYKTYVESQKQMIEQERKRKELDELSKKEQEMLQKKVHLQKKEVNQVEATLKQKKKEEDVKRVTGHALFSEAKKRLKLALEKDNLQEAHLAEAMLQGFEKIQEEEEEKRKEIEKLQKEVEKKKSFIISSAFPNTPET